jgi:hypothetical protein
MHHHCFDSQGLPSKRGTFHVRYLNKYQVINEINQHHDLQLNPSQLANKLLGLMEYDGSETEVVNIY